MRVYVFVDGIFSPLLFCIAIAIIFALGYNN